VQAIRKVRDLGWKPLFFMSNISASVPVVLEPAGLESSIGLLSSAYGKDPRDPAFENDPAMTDWRAWMRKYLPDADVRLPSYVNGYNSAATMVQVLKQAGGDLSRENIMRQATNLRARAPDAAAGSQGLHQSDGLLCDPAVAADAV
jgi:branched-chain amino acid transport system substrate-binding protein